MVQEHETDRVFNATVDGYFNIDRKIVPLIEALWRLGIKTHNSCEANIPIDDDEDESIAVDDGLPDDELCVWVEFQTMYDFCHFLSIVDHYMDRNVVAKFDYDILSGTYFAKYDDPDSLETSVSVRFYPVFLEEMVCVLNRAYTQNIKIDTDEYYDPEIEIYERETPHELHKLRQLLDRYNDGYKCHISLKNDEFIIEFFSCNDYEKLVYITYRYFTQQEEEEYPHYKNLLLDEHEKSSFDRTSLHLIKKNKRLYVSLSWRIKMEDLYYIESALDCEVGVLVSP